jgi:UDP-N-acetylmuramoylalanine--D-glutamate ligase
MIPISSFANKTVAVFGLGGSGLASCHALKAGGANVIASDDSADKLAEATRAGFITADLRKVSWEHFAALLLTPGVPLTHPTPHWTVVAAGAAGVPVIGDIELFCIERRKIAPGSPFIAITGTNGKSTTTALIAHILRSAGRDVQMGGNIGTAILSLEPPAADRFHVIECSSYQIDLAPTLDPSIGILINLSPDHIDRHGTMENYAAVKERLIAQSQIGLVGVDDEYSYAIGERWADREKPIVIPVSAARHMAWGYFARGTHIVSKANNKPMEQAEILGDLAGIGSLRGQHNAQNAAFACGVAWHCGLTPDEIAHGLRTFPGLAHRMEQVGRQGDVLFVNDSKGTNADAAARALSSFDNIFWIAGGKPKEGGITGLVEFFPRIKKAYLIGEAAPEFAGTLGTNVPHEISQTLDRAVADAARDAAASGLSQPVVLLSPACASFDQYRNFEIRGDRFRELVLALPGMTSV